jgi:hypothetical protein
MNVPTLRGLALLAGLSCVLVLPARAQVSAPLIHWQLEVIENGATVDTFKADTPLEQTQTETRQHEATHEVGCADKPAAHIVLTRSIAVTPSSSDEHGVSFLIDATEMLEDPAAQHTNEGCTLPPQPRVVHATHPALLVGKTGWTDWQVVARDPVLVYRLQASADAPAGPDGASGVSGAAASPSADPGVQPAVDQSVAAQPATPPLDLEPDPGPPDVTVPDDSPSQ